MRKFLLLPLFALILAACSNEFDVTAPWKEIPVVYAILSASDSVNYIRVEKAFLDPEKGADQLAQIADSIYYPANAISVFLERVSNQQRWPLERVDGALEGIIRDPGTFATSPNWLYKIKAPIGTLTPGEQFRLIIKRADGNADITAVTTIPNNFIFQSPNPADIPPKIGFLPDKTSEVRWRADANAAYFNVTMHIRFREENASAQVQYRRTIQWDVLKNVGRKNVITQIGGQPYYTSSGEIAANDFFKLLADSIPPADPGRFRYFDGIDLTLEGGGSEILEYQNTANANAGITGSEIITTYTNLSEGFGIFTSKNRSRLLNTRVSEQTIDAMNDLVLTKPLNFRR
jgi:hypothetical protein